MIISDDYSISHELSTQTCIDNTSPLESISAILNGPFVVSVDTLEYAINPAPDIP
jgi:hypothetical protein